MDFGLYCLLAVTKSARRECKQESAYRYSKTRNILHIALEATSPAYTTVRVDPFFLVIYAGRVCRLLGMALACVSSSDLLPVHCGESASSEQSHWQLPDGVF